MTATATGTKNCGRCGGSGIFDHERLTDCWRCGGTGKEATGFDGQDVSIEINRSRTRRDGSRAGVIDTVATITTSERIKVGRYGVSAWTPVAVSIRVVGTMVDGTAFDLTIRPLGTDEAARVAFQDKAHELWQKVRAGIGTDDSHRMTTEEVDTFKTQMGI